MPRNIEKIFDFLSLIENLKSTLRYSKLRSGRQESSAEHSWRAAVMVLILASKVKPKIDICKTLKIALIHDLAESVTGDIDYVLTADGKVSKKEKQKLEKEATIKLKKSLPKDIGDEIYNLWRSYQESKTREAKFVKALDKLETLTQLVESGYKIYDRPELIATHADEAVSNFPELKPVLKSAKQKLKAEFKKGNFPWKEEYDGI